MVDLTMQDQPEYAREALAGGETGYVIKEAADSEPVEAVRRAAFQRGISEPEPWGSTSRQYNDTFWVKHTGDPQVKTAAA